MQSGVGGTYEYFENDGFDRMVSSVVDYVRTGYKYYPNGLRQRKTANGQTTTHVWDGTNISLDIVGVGFTKYIRGINLIASESSGVRKYYLFNAHGDVVQLADTSGNAVKRYDYDAFGVEKSPDANDANPFRYCGEYFDKETGTVYLRARYYDPVIGRFLSEDPIRAGLNWYTYCESNPVLYIDPLGLDAYVYYDPNASSYTNTIMTAWQKSLAKEYNLKTSQVHLISLAPTENDTSKEVLINNWNAMGTDAKGKDVSIDAVVFYGHSSGDNWRIYTDPKGKNNVTVKPDFINGKDFDKKEIGTLIMTGCNMGKTSGDAKRTNFASQMAVGKHVFDVGVVAASNKNHIYYEKGKNGADNRGKMVVLNSGTYKLYDWNYSTKSLDITSITKKTTTPISIGSLASKAKTAATKK